MPDVADRTTRNRNQISTEEDPPAHMRKELDAIAHERAKEESLREFLRKAEADRADRGKKGFKSALDVNTEDEREWTPEELKTSMSPEAWQRHLDFIERGKALVEEIKKGGCDQ